MNLRVLIVDDEALARARLRKLLSEEPQLEVLGECANGPDAIEFTRTHRPDLVFLDVQMPEVSGFDVLQSLAPGELPAVVFVTAHDQHAVEAFRFHALDYLLKPFTQGRLHEAVERAREQLEARAASSLNKKLLGLLHHPDVSAPATPLGRLVVKKGNQTFFVKVEDVDYIEAAANYAILHTATENHLLRETLTNLEEKLPRDFLRVSRSSIVNLNRVKSLQSTPKGEYLVCLEGNRQVLVTRGAQEVRNRLEFL